MHATGPLPPPPSHDPGPAGRRPWSPPDGTGSLPPPPATPPPATPGAGSSDRSRAGAVWVTATGAFLLLAAAALFVAVRWDRLGDPARLGILAAATGGCLLAGRVLRDGLPATSRVLSHLGALLVPLDVAAVALHLAEGGTGPAPWAPVLAATSTTAVLAWWGLARSEGLPLLRLAAGAAVVPAAAGLAGTAGLPAPALLVAAAVGAELIRTTAGDRPAAEGARRCALGWALVAGLGPTLAAAAEVAGLDRLAVGTGVAGADGAAVAMATGLVAAVVLARVARAIDQPALLLAAGATAALGLTAGQAEVGLGLPALVLAWAGATLVVELAALALRHDAFWGRPAHLAAVAAEVLAIVLPAAVLVATLDVAEGIVHRPVLAGAGAVGAAAWLVADLRRATPSAALGPWQVLVGGGWAPATVGAAATLVAGVLGATDEPAAVGSALLVVAVAVVGGGRPLGPAVAAVGAVGGTLAWAAAGPVGGLAAGAVGAATLAWSAALRRPLGRPDDEAQAWLLTLTAAGVPLVALPGAVDGLGATVALPATVVVLGLVAAVADRGVPSVAAAHRAMAAAGPAEQGTTPLGHALRGAAVVLVGAAAVLVPDAELHGTALATGVAAAAAIAAVGLAVEAHRRHDHLAAGGLAVVASAGLAGSLWAVGATTPAVGLGLCALAVAAAGAHLVAAGPWRTAAAGTALVAGAAGAIATTGAPGAAATSAILLGGAALVAGAGHRRADLAAAGGAGVVLGCWAHLAIAEVGALDAWVAPVAVALVVAGVVGSRVGASSWVAYGPAIALLGGTALVERIDGGGGVHALVAGAVGVAAVAVGGARRLAAPLVTGTGLLVALVVRESLAYTAGVPTWAWLAAGGALLVGVGVWLERHATGPFEAGQRLVDVVRRRYR